MKQIIAVFSLLMLFSCNSSEISKDFNCKSGSYSNLEQFIDFKKNFNMKIPKNWKTSYYYDNVVSSIYTADTTLNLTKTTLIDVSFILSPAEFDKNFTDKIKADNKQMKLQEVASKSVTFLKKPSYYNLSEGKKGKYKYTILNIFTKQTTGFLHIKTEVYGDTLINERLCKAVNLIDKIEFH